MKKTTEDLAVNSKEIGLEVNADESKYMVKSRSQNAGWCHSIKTDNGSFEMEEGSNIVKSKLYSGRN